MSRHCIHRMRDADGEPLYADGQRVKCSNPVPPKRWEWLCDQHVLSDTEIAAYIAHCLGEGK